MDLSKVFDYITHDLLIAKMKAYGFSEDLLILIPRASKQSVNITNVHSVFQILLLGALQEPILGPLLLSVFINDPFYSIKDAQLLNFADGNTVATFSKSVDDLITEHQIEFG